jgi:hypothetical protein
MTSGAFRSTTTAPAALARLGPHPDQEGPIMTAATTAPAPTLLRRRSREALTALAVEFVLGMSVNLLPDDGSGAVRVLRSVVLGLHVLVGIGIVIVAVRVLLAARRQAVGATEALWALVAAAITFVAGVLTIVLHSDWFSFLMAVGFLATAALYVRTLVLSGARPVA